LSKEPADSQPEEDKSVASGSRSVHENIYATLPKSLKSELLVSSSEEDPELIASRMELVNSKSVSELSQIKSLADFPVPETVEKLMEKLGHKGDPEEAVEAGEAGETGEGEEGEAAPGSPRPPTSLSVKDLGDGIYASLPRSLKDQLIVRTKEEPQDEVLAARRELVETKSPAELSEIHGLADFPLPTRIEAWVAGTGAEAATEGSEGIPEDSPMALPRNRKEFTEVLYRGLPQGLTQPCVVRSKVEDLNVLIERQQLQQTKSIHELSKIRNLNEIPIPNDCIKLPDVPLPKMKDLLNIIARPPPRSSPKRTPKSETYHSFDAPESQTMESTPCTEERMEHSVEETEEESACEEGYEAVTAAPAPVPVPVPVPAPVLAPVPVVIPSQEEEEEEEEDQFSLAEQIRATPERSLKKEMKKKKNRRSADSSSEEVVLSVSPVPKLEMEESMEQETPPPLPPKRTMSPKKAMSVESQPSFDEEIEAVPVKPPTPSQPDQLPIPPKREKQSSQPREMTEKVPGDPVQSRPLPAPPAPPRSLKKNRSVDSDGRDSRASRTASPSCYRDVGDVTTTENFRTCAETMNTSKTLVDSANRPHSSLSQDVTLADSCVDSLVSCAETLVGDRSDPLDTCADTLRDDDQTEFFSDDDLDNPYPAVDFDSMMDQGPGAGAVILDRPGRSEIKKTTSGRRLEEGTEQLSVELMEHVESLKTTLDNMSSRLGTRSRSRSHSKTRPSSQYRPSDAQQ